MDDMQNTRNAWNTMETTSDKASKPEVRNSTALTIRSQSDRTNRVIFVDATGTSAEGSKSSDQSIVSSKSAYTQSEDWLLHYIPTLEAVQDGEADASWITVSNPGHAKNEITKRLVRSQAAKSSHTRRRQEFKDLRKIPSTAEGSRTTLGDKRPAGSGRYLCSCGHISNYQECTHSLVSHTRIYEQIDPKSLLTASRTDPFSSYATTISKPDRQVLDHFMTYYCPQVDAFHESEYHKLMTSVWAKESIHNPLLLESALFQSNRNLAAITKDPKYKLKTLQSRIRMISKINQALNTRETSTSDHLIAALLSLGADEIYSRDWKTYNMHFSALKTVVDMRGGLQNIGFKGTLSMLILRVDLAGAFQSGGRTHFEHTLRPMTELVINALTPGFRLPEIFSNLSIEVIAILEDLCLIGQFFETSPGVPLPLLGPVSQHTLRGCEDGLLTLCTRQEPPSSLLENPDIETCIGFASEAIRSRIFCGYPLEMASFNTSRNLLRNYLRIADLPKESLSTEVKLWLCFAGHVIDQTGEIWPGLWQSVATDLGISTWEDARAVLKMFLWVSRSCEPIGLDLWQLAQRTRE